MEIVKEILTKKEKTAVWVAYVRYVCNSGILTLQTVVWI